MKLERHDSASNFEDLIAEITDAAYRAALRHGVRGVFLDLELEIWHSVREVLDAEFYGAGRAGRADAARQSCAPLLAHGGLR
jgi:hypothetical protein